MCSLEMDGRYWKAAFYRVCEEAAAAGASSTNSTAAAELTAEKVVLKNTNINTNIFTQKTSAEYSTETKTEPEIDEATYTNQDRLIKKSEEKATQEEKIAKAQKAIAQYKPTKQYPEWNINEDKVYQEFKKFRKERPDYLSQCKDLNKQGKTDAEILKSLVEEDRQFVEQDAKFLREKFDEDPTLRTKMQENFDQLTPEEQKALCYEAAMSGRQTDKEETMRLLTNISNAREDVKVFALTSYKLANPESAQNVDVIAKAVVANEKMLSWAFNNMNVQNQKSCANYMCELGTKEGMSTFAENVHTAKKEVALDVASALENSKIVKENEDIQKTLAANTHKWDKDVRADVHNKLYAGESFGSEGRGALISNIKNFDDAKEQLKLADFANSNIKTDEDNRMTLATQIKSFDPSIQSQFAKTFAETKENQTEKIMKTFAEEIPKMNEDKVQKDKLLEYVKETKKVPEKVIKEIQKHVEKQIKLVKQNINLNMSQQDAFAEMRQVILNITGNAELTEMIISGEFSEKAPALSVFVDLLGHGTLTPELVISVGRKDALINNFTALTQESQEQVFDMLTPDEISEMWAAEKIPKRFKNRVMAKLAKNMNTTVAKDLARTGNFSEVVNFAKTATTTKHQDIFKDALKKRFSKEELSKHFSSGFFA